MSKIQEQIEELRSRLWELEAKVKEEEKPKRWRAEKYKVYYFVDMGGGVMEDNDHYLVSDDDCYKTGNYFKTEDQAKNSFLHHVLNGEYFYKLPKVDTELPSYDEDSDGNIMNCKAELLSTKTRSWIGVSGFYTDVFNEHPIRWRK